MHDTDMLEGFDRLAQGADYVEVKVGEGGMSLREFVAGILSYRPGWMAALYRVRVWLLTALGQGKRDVSDGDVMTADSLPINPGDKADFFEVVESDGESRWIAVGQESHLDCMIGAWAQPACGKPGVNRFHLVTIVRYRSWAGPVYFNIIRPFHHLVVYFAMRNVLR